MNKPTPGPWVVEDCDGWLRLKNPDVDHVLQISWEHRELDDIDRANAALIVSAVNACFAVNPNNPLAVVETIPEMAKLIRAVIPILDSTPFVDTGNIRGRLHAALTKLGTK